MTNGFKWTGWLKPINQKLHRYHVIRVDYSKNLLEIYDINENGKKVECSCPKLEFNKNHE